MQPSAQGIASMFMGNPGALAARVDQDRKQSPMGIPDDLRQLMALNIVTNETDAAKRQQAMNELQQMAPNGQPPTVADSVRQQAAQKLQARMVQEQQKAQAMQQMVQGLPAAGIPQGVPQPERQPQGIDEAPVEFGMASGGIVSFQEGGRGKYETAYDRMTRENREEEDRRRREEEGRPVDPQAAADRAAIAGLLQSLRGGSETVGRAIADVATMIPRGLVGAYDTAVVRPMRAAGVNAAYLSPLLTPEGTSPESMTPFTDVARARDAKEQPARTAPIPTSQGPGDRIVPRYAATASAPAPAPASRRAPPTAGLPAAIAAARPAPESQPAAPATPEYEDAITLQGVLNQADAARLQRQAEYAEKVGKPSTAAIDRLMAEYERQKAEAAGPQPGIAGLTEYLAQIAATPRGMTSFEAGAAGARGVQALEKERAARRAGLTEKQIELEQKRLDADRQYAKEVLGVGDAQYDRALRANLSLFEEQGKNKRQAMSDAAALTREQFRADAEKEAIKIRAQYQQQLQAMPSAEERLRKQAMDAYKTKFPGADDYTAMQALGFLGPKGGYESAATALRAAQSTLEDPYSTPEEQAAARQTRSAILQGMRPGSNSQTSTTAPAVGTIMGGYRFKGGNPSDKKNWEKV